MPRKKTSKPFYQRHWGSNEARYRSRLLHHLEKLRLERPRYWWRERRIWQKILILLVALVVLTVGSMYGIARWYIAAHDSEQLQLGTTFVPGYAQYYGLG